LLNQLRQALPFDKLHRIEVHAPLAANRVDTDNVWVVELRGGLGFVLESLQLAAIEDRGQREDLQRHAASKGQLPRFVDNPHPAAANFTYDLEVAQGLLQLDWCRPLKDRPKWCREPPNLLPVVEELAQLSGILRMATKPLSFIDRLPGLDHLQQVGDYRVELFFAVFAPIDHVWLAF
jgi:hypothetical protein